MFFLGAILLFCFLLRLWLSGFSGLHPDEAYYWVWSRHLKLGYYDHPPMVAWIIRAGDVLMRFLVPHSTWDGSPVFFGRVGLRLVPYFLTCFVAPLIIGRAIEVSQRKPLRVSQIVVLLTAPIFVFGPQVVTPDAPFFTAWALVLLLSLHMARTRPPSSFAGDPTPFSFYRSVTIGIVLAFAAYSKYSAILAAFLFVITGAGLYNAVVAGLVCLVLMLPHVLWTYKVGLPNQAGLFFQLNHGLGDLGARPNFKFLGDLVVGQIFLWTPPVFVGAALLPIIDFRYLFTAQKKSHLVGTLFLWAMVPVVFFALASLKHPSEANWPLMGALAGITLVLARLRSQVTALAGLFIFNLFVLFVCTVLIVKSSLFSPVASRFSPKLAESLNRPSRLEEFENWDRFHQIIFEATSSKKIPVEIQSYQTLSELLFYDSFSKEEERFGDRLKIWMEGSRASEFNLEPEYKIEKAGTPRWLIARNPEWVPSDCNLNQTVFKSPTEVQTFSVYRCGF